MIRRSVLSLKFANQSKLDTVSLFLYEANRVLNLYVPILWKSKNTNKFQATPSVDTWLSARAKQCILKQAVEVVKSQRKKKKKTMPVVKSTTLTLDERFVSFRHSTEGLFDIWVHLQSLGSKVIINLPAKKHKHFNKFYEKGWTLKKACRIRETEKGILIDVFFEKEAPPVKKTGDSLGIDIGYKKLIATSQGTVFGEDLTRVYNKLGRKKQGSTNFLQVLKERDQLVSKSVKQLPLSRVNLVVVEALKNVKKGTKGVRSKQFNNRLSRWTYPKVLGKLQMLCEEQGIEVREINPAYTSQTCSQCGFVDKNSRKGEQFLCTKCGYLIDADYNASINILQRGIYSSPSKEALL